MSEQDDEVNFFGITIKVRNSKLAAVLNSDVTEDVVVVARRARHEGEVDNEAPEVIATDPLAGSDAVSGAAPDRAVGEAPDKAVDEAVDEAPNAEVDEAFDEAPNAEVDKAVDEAPNEVTDEAAGDT